MSPSHVVLLTNFATSTSSRMLDIQQILLDIWLTLVLPLQCGNDADRINVNICPALLEGTLQQSTSTDEPPPKQPV